MNKRILFGISFIIATHSLFVLLTQNSIFRFALISNDYKLVAKEMMKTFVTTIIVAIVVLLIVFFISLLSGTIIINKVGKDKEDDQW